MSLIDRLHKKEILKYNVLLWIIILKYSVKLKYAEWSDYDVLSVRMESGLIMKTR